ncbi:MAG: TonB-dependent receptor [Deltaproteobacteria bacterium]|nr:TonB-dependent receptor [Deltaproteobacteria bacterium]
MRTLPLTAALLAPALVLANGYDVPNTAARDSALAGSATAAQVDAGATYANPAALARLGAGLQLSLSGSILNLETKWTDTSGTLSPSPATTKRKPVPPVALYASYGFKLGDRNAAVGLGMNVPGGGNVFWDDQWAGRGRIVTVDRKIYGAYLTGGYEVAKQLRIGGGLVYYYGTEYLKQGVQPFPGTFGELSTKGGAVAFDLAAEAAPFDGVPLGIGVDFKYHAKMKLKGDGHFINPPPALAGQMLDQGVTHELPYPSVLNAGLSYKPASTLLLTLGFTYTWYSIYEEDLFVGDKGMTILVPRNYGNGTTWRLGAEWQAHPVLQLRAGVLRDLSGLSTDTYSPTLPDADSWVAAVGAGWAATRDLTVNAAFFRAFLDKVTATGPEALPGRYQTSVWIATLGVSWRTGLGQ